MIVSVLIYLIKAPSFLNIQLNQNTEEQQQWLAQEIRLNIASHWECVTVYSH